MSADTQAPKGTPSAYLIHCIKDEEFGACGESTFLTQEEYDKQMSRPNRGWQCLQCGVYPCDFDDENFEKAVGIA